MERTITIYEGHSFTEAGHIQFKKGHTLTCLKVNSVTRNEFKTAKAIDSIPK